MSQVNKESLREEFTKIKSEFNKLSSNKRMSREVAAVMQSMMLLLQIMISIFLEKNTRKTSKNSSKPPSQTGKDNTTRTQSNSKGLSINGQLSSNTRTVETTTVTKVDTCEGCGQDLKNSPSERYERRSKIDIVFEKVIYNVDAEIKTCTNCESVSKGDFPIDMPGKKQYGIGIKAYVVNLLITQMVALNRVQKMMHTLIGVVISEATILKYVLELYVALEDWEQRATKEVLGKPTIYTDETSIRVNKKNHWIHVYSSGDITLKFLHEKRGSEAIDEIGIIPRYGGVIVHDCWASYLSYGNCRHGLCGSHLLRELTFIVESNNYSWAANMKKLLQNTCKQVTNKKNKKLTLKEYNKLQKHYRNILTRGEKELPELPQRSNGKRGRIAKSDAHNLWERLKTHEEAVLLFARESEVAFTNNRAEQDLRMSKVKQKVSGCFRQLNFAQAYCRISSYLQSQARQGINPHVAIQMAFSGEC